MTTHCGYMKLMLKWMMKKNFKMSLSWLVSNLTDCHQHDFVKISSLPNHLSTATSIRRTTTHDILKTLTIHCNHKMHIIPKRHRNKTNHQTPVPLLKRKVKSLSSTNFIKKITLPKTAKQMWSRTRHSILEWPKK